MLYLFGTGAWKGNRKAIKVGYTGDIEKRKEQYKLHNPLGEIIDTREGNEVLEEKLHLRLFDYKVEFLDEWFYDEDPVFKIFNESEDSINKWLWENKDRVLIYPSIPLPGTLKRKILDELREIFNKPSILLGEKLL